MSSVRISTYEQNNFEDCRHDTPLMTPSPHAAEAGYVHKPPTRNSRKSQNGGVPPAEVYPAPLVLPGDDLSLDPQSPPQSVQSWQRAKERNLVTREKNVIYVAAPPDVDPHIDFVNTWTHATTPHGTNKPRKQSNSTRGTQLPDSRQNAHELLDYLAAFYYPLAVKSFPSQLTYTLWDEETTSTGPIPPTRSLRPRKRKFTPSCIALRTSNEVIRIRTRLSPDSIFPSQLKLDDLLDVAISILPSNAYALLLLVSHDLYEDDDDVFVCGRAYGGSRVAVVSTARYNPSLDDIHGVDREHAWPASHCKRYVEACCSAATKSPPKSQKTKKMGTGAQGAKPSSSTFIDSSPGPASSPRSPMDVALHQHVTDPPSLPLLYLIRLALTAAHEVGHCSGLEHCTYYACCMQGSASLAEDARQPPYMCPVCEEKVVLATGADRKERLRKIREVCERWGWGTLEGWVKAVLGENEASGEGSGHGTKEHIL
ncbi:MAG: hypothetical protein LQ346_002215 [Caloplaca aetnensis]|nr:MAG: hypothetical protein LQ346_002215 [Caloplaca aetnensis]